jgi:protein-disulfide isomerase
LAIDLTKAEITGPPDAGVELVVFSDFTCKFCIELAQVLKKVREKFPTEVLVAHRDFPLGDSGAGFTAAVAGRCAAEQGAFWAYHDRLFAESGVLPEEKLLSIAMELGLDGPRFTQCLHSEKAKAAVIASSREALDIGVPGSPALFLNGVLIGGLVDYATLEKKVREELDRARAPETP